MNGIKDLQFYVDLIDKGEIDSFTQALPSPDQGALLPTFPNNYTLLHYAVRNGKARIALHLLDNKYFDINSCLDSFDNSVLIEACRGESLPNVDCVAQLANYPEINLFHRNSKRMNALEVACAESKCKLHFYKEKKSCIYERICSILIKAGGIPILEACHGMHLYFAIRNEHRSIVKMFLNPSYDLISHQDFIPNLFDEFTHGSLRNCQTREMAEIVFEEGHANVNARDHRFRTALHIAASFGRSQVCKYLIEKGADPNANDEQGKTPLFMCCESISNVYPDADWVGTVTCLLEAGTVINQNDLEYNMNSLEYLLKFKKDIPEAKKSIEVLNKSYQERDNINHGLFKQFALKSLVNPK